MGAKAAMCPGTCSDWYAACSQDFFGFQGQRQGLQPCTEADTDRFAVCAKLHELAGDGAGLCEAAGACRRRRRGQRWPPLLRCLAAGQRRACLLRMGPARLAHRSLRAPRAGFKVAAADGSEPCFDGRPSAAAAELCAGAPLAQPQRAASSDDSDGGGASGGRAMMLDVVQTLRNATLTAAIAMLLARLFRAFQRQRGMQVALRRADPAVLADAAVRRVSAH